MLLEVFSSTGLLKFFFLLNLKSGPKEVANTYEELRTCPISSDGLALYPRSGICPFTPGVIFTCEGSYYTTLMLCYRCRFHRFVVVVVIIVIVGAIVVAIAVVIVVVVAVAVAQKCKTAPVQRDAGFSATSWIVVVDPEFQHDSIF